MPQSYSQVVFPLAWPWRLFLVALVPLAALSGLAGFVVAEGEVERYGPALVRQNPPPPEWTAPCQRIARDSGRAVVLRCMRFEGRVLYVQERDEDEGGEPHLLVVAGPRILNVKLPASARASGLPRIGDWVEGAGHSTSGRFGMTEITVHALDQ